jgi:hypothetical protein
MQKMTDSIKNTRNLTDDDLIPRSNCLFMHMNYLTCGADLKFDRNFNLILSTESKLPTSHENYLRKSYLVLARA